jgi:hypothetical protein
MENLDGRIDTRPDSARCQWGYDSAMKTKIEWRHGSKVLKIDDTSYGEFPVAGAVVEMDERGVREKFQVASIESAVVNLESYIETPDVAEQKVERVEPRFTVERPSPVSPPKSRSVALSATARGNHVSSKVVSHKKK